MFNQKQLEVLNQELDSSRIKSRSKGNINLSYIEGHDALETANKVFGFGNWTYSVTKLEQVSQEVNQNQNNVVCYKAVVQILVHCEDHSKDVSREDVGFGTGTAKTLADAHEGGAKEAVTDALKRALRSFGNQFGNSLYNKDRNSSTQNYQQPANNNYQQQNHSQSLNNQSSQQTYQYQQDFVQLTNLGLNVVQQGNILIVTGDEIFEKKEAIKNAGFRWSSQDKLWYMQLRQAA